MTQLFFQADVFLNLTEIGIAVAALGFVALGVYVKFESVWYKVTRMNLPLAKLPEAFEGLVLVHLTDLHFNPRISPERFAEVVERVNAQSPDVIVITGDFIDRHTRRDQIPLIVEQLGQLQAKLGKFAVLGNHDYGQGAAVVRAMLEESGIRELPNQAAPLYKDEQMLTICGLDDYKKNKLDFPALLAEMPEEGCAILLVHEPDFADISGPTGRFSLQLSGHSHGGQINIPFLGPPITPKHAHRYPRGLYQVGEMKLYTNTGVGMTPPLVRFNCRPEIAVFTLTGKTPED